MDSNSKLRDRVGIAVCTTGISWLTLGCSGGENVGAIATGGVSSTGGESAGGAHSGGTTTVGQAGSAGRSDRGSAGSAGGAGGGTQQTTSGVGVTFVEANYYRMNATYHGYCTTASDADQVPPGSSQVNPKCGGEACFTNETHLCASGKAGQVVGTASAQYWGVSVGCNLNQDQGDDTSKDTASLAGKSSLKVALNHNPPGALVQLTVLETQTDGSMAEVHYCADLPTSDSIALTDLTKNCQQQKGTAFDPSTMQAESLEVVIPAASSKDIFFDICLNEFSIE